MMKSLFVFLMMSFITSYALAYDEYNILVDSTLNKDELEYFQQNCKRNEFSYVCIAISQKMGGQKNGK